MSAMSKHTIRNIAAGVAIAATIGVGAFALSTVLPAGAQTNPTSSSSATADGGHGPRARAKAALDELVTNGTINQDQENAVIQALEGARGNGKAPLARLRGLLGEAVKVAADKIGITPADLRAELKDGKSIADVATEHNVSVDDVKQALTDAATARINQAVSNNRLTQDQANKIEQRLPTVIDKLVNHHKGDGAGG